jgi:hypothetical protein
MPKRAYKHAALSRLLGAMTVTIEFDAPIDVVDEMTQAIVVVLGAIERVEKPAKHLRDNVFAPVEERRQDLFGRARIGKRQCMRDKGLQWAGAPIRGRAISTGMPTNTSERNFSNWRVLAPMSIMARR